MRTALSINGSPSPTTNYLTWAPSPCQVSLADATGATAPVTVELRNQRPGVGGQVVFFAALTGVGQPNLTLILPLDGTPVSFHTGGSFGNPSVEDKDAAIEIVEKSSGTVLSVTQLMVRIRKNANTLLAPERDRFVNALATFNNRGMGRFRDIRDMHTSIAIDEAHRRSGFLPWHRSYLLDLERELQAIDSSVTIPYWRFDQPAPQLFDPQFLGETDASGGVQFKPGNPLEFWKTDTVDGISREPLFDQAMDPAGSEGIPVRDELSTLGLGGGVYGNISGFRDLMEGNPHGSAHVSFSGPISSPPTAPKDPLFFLLHTNVDRLWAKWQWKNHRFNIGSSDSYPFLGSAGTPGATRIGHNLNDTMWPWNQVTTPPRPLTAPGGTLAVSPIAAAPGLSPFVRDMIDYQGIFNSASRLGFDYDDVPFEF